MTFIDYDPKRHEGKQLYELQTVSSKGVFITVPVPVDTPHKEAAKTPWYYVVEEEEEKVKKAQDLEKLVKRQAKEKALPPSDDDDPIWEVDEAYLDELASRVEAGMKKSTKEEAEGD